MRLKPGVWFFLFLLAKLGAINRAIRISGSKLAKEMGISQQTASRLLIELDSLGLIERKTTAQGYALMLTGKGVGELEGVYSTLRTVFEPIEESLQIEGEVFEGLGEGRWYVSQPSYRGQFVERLGFDPYPGTLNLRLDPVNKTLRERLEHYPYIPIEGFATDERSFGFVKCFRGIINDRVEGAAVITERGHYNSSVLELIAPVCLKKRFALKAGSKVRVKIILSK